MSYGSGWKLIARRSDPVVRIAADHKSARRIYYLLDAWWLRIEGLSKSRPVAIFAIVRRIVIRAQAPGKCYPSSYPAGVLRKQAVLHCIPGGSVAKAEFLVIVVVA